MCDELTILEFIEMDWKERRTENRKRRQLTRKLYDPFEMDGDSFIKQYRLSIDLVQSLCEELTPFLPKVIKSSDISVETKVLTTLYFYAHGSLQKPIGENKGLCMSQPTVSGVLAQVTTALNYSEIYKKYVTFPSTFKERIQTWTRFYQKYKIPGVIGCIDNTHIAIMKPFKHGEKYLNNKQYHSLNVQLICNADMKIISVDASHGGATHESQIWMDHPLRPDMEKIADRETMWLLGNTGYPLRKTLLTPILDAAPKSPDEYYTTIHEKARTSIEQTIENLKTRFRCLLSHQSLHYDPQMASSIVNACCILHNICNEANVPIQALTEEEVRREKQMQPIRVNYHGNRMSNRGAEDIARMEELKNLNDDIETRQNLVQKLYNFQQIGYPYQDLSQHPSGTIFLN